MARKKTVHQIFIIDSSGSMERMKEEVITGFRDQIKSMAEEQKNNNVNYLVSLVTFSDKAKRIIDSQKLSDDLEIKNTYRPSGMTALYDAIGGVIFDPSFKENSKTIVTIMTDGQENSSREYKRDVIAAKIKELEAKGVAFVYFGSNQDAWEAAGNLGISNALNYADRNLGVAMMSMSNVRHAYTVGGQSVNSLHKSVDQKRLVQ